MLQTSLNIFDLGVLLIIGLSALLSFFRGFAREILSLGAWIGATVITLYTFPTVSKWIEPQVKSQMIASGLASLGVFIIALIFISIISGILIKFIKPSKEIGFIDNMVGLLFGVARGVLLVSIGYFIMTLVMSEKDYPEWVKDAATRPYVAESAHYVAKLTPTYLSDAIGEQAKEMDKKSKEHNKPSLGKAGKVIKVNADEVGEDVKSEIADHTKNLPSFEELQRRIRAENGSK